MPACPCRYLTSLGLPLADGASRFAAPYVLSIVVANVGGWVADELLLRRLRLSVLRTRKIVQSVAYAVPITCFTLLATQGRGVSPQLASTLLTMAIAAFSLSASGYLANMVDISGGPAMAGALMGVSNTLGTLPGILANGLTGWMLEASGGDWSNVFRLAVALYAIGLAVYLRFAKGQPPKAFALAHAAAANGAAGAGAAGLAAAAAPGAPNKMMGRVAVAD